MLTKTSIISLSQQMILYVINEEDLEHFKDIACMHVEKLPPTIPDSLQNLNIFVTVSNVWFALKYDKHYYLDETRRMTHAAAYFQLEYISRYRSLQQFISLYKLSDVQLFFLAYFVGLASMNWVISIMERIDMLTLIEHYSDENNFILNDQYLPNDTFQRELFYQTIYMKEMVKNSSQTTEFNDALDRAINETKIFIHSYDYLMKKK